jgi:hypothetical protein
MSFDPAVLRESIDGVQFPATKVELLEHARDDGADDELLAELDRLPAGMTFSTATEVSMRLKELTQTA